MKILYLKGYKRLLSQNQHVRNDFFGYRRYEALAKHTKPFLKKHKTERKSAPGLLNHKSVLSAFGKNLFYSTT